MTDDVTRDFVVVSGYIDSTFYNREVKPIILDYSGRIRVKTGGITIECWVSLYDTVPELRTAIVAIEFLDVAG